MNIYLFISLLAEYEQTEFTLGWALTIGLIFLGLLGICAPRIRSKWPKEMREMKAKEAERAKKQAKRKSTGKKKSAKKKSSGKKKTTARRK